MAVLQEDDPRLAQLQENASSLSQLSTQTVFSMLDHLTQWGRHRLQSLSTAKTSGRHARDQTPTPASGQSAHSVTLLYCWTSLDSVVLSIFIKLII